METPSAPRFTLQPRTWYAMEYTFPSSARHVSPIWVMEVNPRKSGRGEMDLRFWHANYSEGVQGKEYRLRVLHREAGYLLALDERDAGQCAAILLTKITADWLRLHFPSLTQTLSDRDDLRLWLDRHSGCPQHP